MKCPVCNYDMQPFEKDCPRCHGKGVQATPNRVSSSTQASQTNQWLSLSSWKPYAAIASLAVLAFMGWRLFASPKVESSPEPSPKDSAVQPVSAPVAQTSFNITYRVTGTADAKKVYGIYSYAKPYSVDLYTGQGGPKQVDWSQTETVTPGTKVTLSATTSDVYAKLKLQILVNGNVVVEKDMSPSSRAQGSLGGQSISDTIEYTLGSTPPAPIPTKAAGVKTYTVEYYVGGGGSSLTADQKLDKVKIMYLPPVSQTVTTTSDYQTETVLEAELPWRKEFLNVPAGTQLSIRIISRSSYKTGSILVDGKQLLENGSSVTEYKLP